MSFNGLRHASVLLERLAGSGTEETFRTDTHNEWSQNARKDIDFFIKEISDVEKEILMLKEMVWFTPNLQGNLLLIVKLVDQGSA